MADDRLKPSIFCIQQDNLVNSLLIAFMSIYINAWKGNHTQKFRDLEHVNQTKIFQTFKTKIRIGPGKKKEKRIYFAKYSYILLLCAMPQMCYLWKTLNFPTLTMLTQT